MALILYRRHTKSCGKARRVRNCAAHCPIWVQGTLGGESIRKSLDQTSWEAAERIIHTWKEGGKIGTEFRHAISLKGAIERFLADARMRIKSTTAQLYELTLTRQLVPWCEKRGITDIGAFSLEDIREYRESWKCKAVTAARRIDRLKSFFTFCVDSGWIEKSPAAKLKAPVVVSGDKEPFTQDELRAIYEACDKLVTRGTYGKENRARVKAFIYILRYTGLRISDAVRLDESRVKDGRVLIRTEKTKSVVYVPIPLLVVKALAQVPRVGPFYFQTGNAKPKTVRGGWDRAIRTVLALAGVKHGSAHVFRHTLACDLLTKGVSVENVAAILGNSPDIVRKHYSHWIPARQAALDEAVRRTWVEPESNLQVIQGGV